MEQRVLFCKKTMYFSKMSTGTYVCFYITVETMLMLHLTVTEHYDERMERWKSLFSVKKNCI